MDFEVRQLLSQAAFHGITRKEIATRAGISANSFTNWKYKSPNLGTLKKAIRALDDIIAEQGAAREKVEG